MRCRSDVRLWHSRYLFCYKPFMWCRSDVRLWHVFILFPSRGIAQTLVWFSFILPYGFREDYRPTFIFTYSTEIILFGYTLLEYSHASCLHLLYLMSELSCEYIESTHLACWFGQMLTKAISWMKSSIASPTSSGVPVSLLRSWSWSLLYNRFRQPPNKFIGSHSDTRWTVTYWSHVTHYAVTYPPLFYYELVVCHPTIVSYSPLCIIKACL